MVGDVHQDRNGMVIGIGDMYVCIDIKCYPTHGVAITVQIEIGEDKTEASACLVNQLTINGIFLFPNSAS